MAGSSMSSISTSHYESIRLKNLEDNKRVLASFGLIDPFQRLPNVRQKKTSAPSVKRDQNIPSRKRSKPLDVNGFVGGSVYGIRRKSARIEGKDAADSSIDLDLSALDGEDDTANYTPKVKANRPNFYGAVPDIDVGTVWDTRMECCRDGVHRPTVAGIHGGEDGAYSLALSGGYEDDVDLGECFTYTGEGGRDLKGTKNKPKNLRTAPQSKDQTLTRGNLALSRNVETKNPVRVIRGYKSRSHFAPEDGYRYDGLYTVEKSWFTTGLSGFGVWKFALKRCPGQAPPPWSLEESNLDKDPIYSKDKVEKEDSTDSDKENTEPEDSALPVETTTLATEEVESTQGISSSQSSAVSVSNRRTED